MILCLMRKWMLAGFAVFFLFAAAGCSKQDLSAKFYMFKAEDELTKAAGLKDKKISYDLRVPLYGAACTYFKKALDTDPRVFTLNRIEEASDACWRCGNKENEEIFKNFEAQYAKAHPQEFEHGDSGVAAMDMGG